MWKTELSEHLLFMVKDLMETYSILFWNYVDVQLIDSHFKQTRGCGNLIFALIQYLLHESLEIIIQDVIELAENSGILKEGSGLEFDDSFCFIAETGHSYERFIFSASQRSLCHEFYIGKHCALSGQTEVFQLNLEDSARDGYQ